LHDLKETYQETLPHLETFSLLIPFFLKKKKKPYIALASLYIASKPDNQCSVDKTLNKKKNHVYIRDIYQVAFDYYIGLKETEYYCFGLKKDKNISDKKDMFFYISL
jgi:hypothetical protein